MFTNRNVRKYVHEYQPAKSRHAGDHGDMVFEKSDIPTTGDVSGIELRLSQARILDNRTPNLGPFPGYAKIYFLTLVISDIQNQAVFVDVKGFPKVDDKEDLPIDNTLFYWKKSDAAKIAPSQLHVFTSIIKSKQALRDTGKIMQDAKGDARYTSILETVVKTMASASPVGQIVDQVMNLANIVGSFLGKVEDKPLITVLQSFTDINGDFDVLGKIPKEYRFKYAILGLSLTVRDKEREQLLNT
jgi:hypothetical protein